jgi:hypothetical protein
MNLAMLLALLTALWFALSWLAALLGVALVAAVGLVERVTMRFMGGRA